MKSSKPESKDLIGIGFALAIITGLGAAIRLFYITRMDFPLNDGGMFFEMTNELIENNFRIPQFTQYNSLGIPFAYPPMSFYIAGLINRLMGLDLLQIFRYLPFFFNILTIPAFFMLSHTVLEKPFSALNSTLIFSVLMPGFAWLIMGGGITRSLGFLTSILALCFVVRTLKSQKKVGLLWSTLFTGLTLLSHLEASLILFVWIAISILVLSRNRWGGIVFITVVIGAGIIALPWFITVYLSHGIEPYLAALSSGEFKLLSSLGKVLLSNYTSEFLFTPVLLLSILGLVYEVISRNWLLPLWFFSVILFDARGLERSISIPTSMLSSIAIDHFLESILSISQSKKVITKSRRLINLGVLFLLLYLIIRGSVVSQVYTIWTGNGLEALNQEQIQAFYWIKNNLSEDSRFLVLSTPSDWEVNREAEWFPVLTKRISVNTVQGREWVSGQHFEGYKSVYDDVNKCFIKGLVCLEDVAYSANLDFSYIYLSGKIIDYHTHSLFPSPLELDLIESSAYEIIYSVDGVKIFRRVD